jgi:bacterioferritin
MRGDDEVLALLNEQLTSELTAINQYFLHAKMQSNWGFTKLAEHTRSESIEEMQHAERITDRILFLDGLPNYQKLLPLRIGQTVREQFEADLAGRRGTSPPLTSSSASSPTRRSISTTSRPTWS